MKNLLILALASLLLFSVAAGLSIWLQQSKAPTEPTKDKDDEKKKSAKEKLEPADKEKLPKDKSEVPETVTPKERETAFEKRQARVELILADMRTERDDFDKLSKTVAAETKAAIAAADEDLRLADLKNAQKPNDPPKKLLVPFVDPGEQKNIDKLAAMYDAMAPDAAAKLAAEMSNNGSLETAVQILAKMKDTKLAKVLEAMPDQALAAQIVEKIKKLRKVIPPLAAGS